MNTKIKFAFDCLRFNNTKGMTPDLVEAAEKCGGSIVAWDNNHARYLKENGAKNVVVPVGDYKSGHKAKPILLDSYAAVRLLGDALDEIKELKKSPWHKTKEELPRFGTEIFGLWKGSNTTIEYRPCIYGRQTRGSDGFYELNDGVAENLKAPDFWMYIPMQP